MFMILMTIESEITDPELKVSPACIKNNIQDIFFEKMIITKTLQRSGEKWLEKWLVMNW